MAETGPESKPSTGGVGEPAALWALPPLRGQDQGEAQHALINAESVEAVIVRSPRTPTTPAKRYGSGHAQLHAQRSFRSGLGTLSAQASFRSLQRQDSSSSSLAKPTSRTHSQSITNGSRVQPLTAMASFASTSARTATSIASDLTSLSAGAAEALEKAQKIEESLQGADTEAMEVQAMAQLGSEWQVHCSR